MPRPLCSLDEIPEDGARGLDLVDLAIVAVKSDGQLFLYRNNCPHLGLRLEYQENEFLDLDGAHILCSTHGALFTLDQGECVFGPCLGDHLEAIPFEVRGNTVWIE
ncbi:MAG: Rieske (2Fe-2S) protein [Pseudomonadota bacterium]|nr:Rieske (2Fe-2S) protein [Pseudomonadota bacterium]